MYKLEFHNKLKNELYTWKPVGGVKVLSGLDYSLEFLGVVKAYGSELGV